MGMGRIRLRWHQVWGPMDLTVIVMKEAYCLRPWSCGLLVEVDININTNGVKHLGVGVENWFGKQLTNPGCMCCSQSDPDPPPSLQMVKRTEFRNNILSKDD